MDATGPDVKRARLNYDGPTRISSSQSQQPQQQQPPPISPAHTNNPSILPAPSTYPGSMSQPGPPQSPFHDAPHDVRQVPVEPSVHSFVQHHSGHSTPREGRFPPEMTYPRRESASGTPRSPEDHHFPPPPPPRSMSMATANEAPSYPTQYASDPTGHLIGYQAPDQHMNGNLHHGMALHPHSSEPGSGMGPIPYGEYGPPSMHPSAHPYGGPPYGASIQAQAHLRKKGNRAQQACDVCRSRKAKCDEGRPRCGFCEENGMTCNYQSVAPAKFVSTEASQTKKPAPLTPHRIDRTNQMIIDQISATTTREEFQEFRDELREELKHLKGLLAAVKGHRDTSSTPKDDVDTKPSVQSLDSPSVGSAPNSSSNHANQQASPNKSSDSKVVEMSPNGSFNASLENRGADPFPGVTAQNTIAAEHNTAAQKLFRWPSIKRLLEKSRLRVSERHENFVMGYELNKGPLRLYGRGQGKDPPDYSSRVAVGASSPANSATSGPSDESYEARSPASTPENSWGYGINPFVGEPRSENPAGGLHANNTLKLDPKTIDSLLHSYLRDFHIMHPFLDEQYLIKTITAFKKRYNPRDTVGGNPNVDALRDPSTSHSIPMKRKPSEPHWALESQSAQGSSKTDHPLLERSPTTAMVLLVLALGKLCECRENLPGPVPTSFKEGPAYPGRPHSPSGAFYGQSPPDSASMRHSPSSSGQSMVNVPAASPLAVLRQNHRSPRSSAAELSPQNRNIDLIPGLAYYAQATDILGNLNGSTSLIYIQCCILAGLVAGQFTNSLESLSWIQNAARALCILLSLPDTSNCNERDGWKNSIRFAFHTTSQLENDILAEIDLPRAGLHLIDAFPYPDGYVTESSQHSSTPHSVQNSSYDEVMQFYSSQLHIRGILNQTQHTVYASNGDPKSSLHRPTRDVLDDFIKELRNKLPYKLRWEDDDPPAEGINPARLRGKWYGAQYIIHRPYLHFCLEMDENGVLDSYFARHPYEKRNAGSMLPPSNAAMTTGKEPSDQTVWSALESAKTCIAAAQRSTTAFDGIIDHRRLIVTNIFGTAHAQFGNMLVLSAVYCSKHLKRYISDDPTRTMEHLFARTINILRKLKAISATLGHDQYILECLREVVLKEESSIPAASSSFSSA